MITVLVAWGVLSLLATAVFCAFGSVAARADAAHERAAREVVAEANAAAEWSYGASSAGGSRREPATRCESRGAPVLAVAPRARGSR